MKRLLTTLLITLLLAPLAAPAMVAPPADDGVFVEGARYDAVLDAQAGIWRLLSATGPEWPAGSAVDDRATSRGSPLLSRVRSQRPAGGRAPPRHRSATRRRRSGPVADSSRQKPACASSTAS